MEDVQQLLQQARQIGLRRAKPCSDLRRFFRSASNGFLHGLSAKTLLPADKNQNARE